MFNGHKISKLLEERHLKKKSLIEYMQTYPSGLDAIIKDGNPRADTLEKIADFFRLPIDYFFDRNIEISDLSPLITGNVVASLQQLLAEKERTIQILLNQNK